jgi:hypothetical protein
VRRRLAKYVVVIDLDIYDEDKSECMEPLAIEKALYQYSMIPREIVETQHGMHVYLDIPLNQRDSFYKIFAIRSMFGDDICRLMFDEARYIAGLKANRLFTDREVIYRL